MSTFTNVLQQRINALQNQIRNLQEQNNRLRRRARYLLEAAPSTDKLMVPTADTQTPSEGPLGPLGQYGGTNPDQRYTMSETKWTTPPFGVGGFPATPDEFDLNPDGTYTDENGTTFKWSWRGGKLTVVARRRPPNGSPSAPYQQTSPQDYRYNPQTGQWQQSPY
jgi:hypothetical protein